MDEIVCICDPSNAAILDRPLLTSALGCPAQVGGLKGPDLLLSSAGYSIAFIHAPSYDDTISQRLTHSSSLFTRIIVLSHFSMFSQQDSLSKLMTAACMLGNTSMVLMPVGSTFTQQAIIHAQALFEVERKKREDRNAHISWFSRQMIQVQSSEVGVNVLAGGLSAAAQPPAGFAPQQYGARYPSQYPREQAELLHMLGSVSHISRLPATTIEAQSGISPGRAAAFSAIFTHPPNSSNPTEHPHYYNKISP